MTSPVVSAWRPETKIMPATPRSTSISMYSSSLVPPGAWVHSRGVCPLEARSCSISWANRGKMGLDSSGTISPTRPREAWWRDSGRS